MIVGIDGGGGRNPDAHCFHTPPVRNAQERETRSDGVVRCNGMFHGQQICRCSSEDTSSLSSQKRCDHDSAKHLCSSYESLPYTKRQSRPHPCRQPHMPMMSMYEGPPPSHGAGTLCGRLWAHQESCARRAVAVRIESRKKKKNMAVPLLLPCAF